jgi:predicted N-formylglutamate amidohydrolase
MSAPSRRLLSADNPAPVTVSRREGSSPFFLTREHAGRTIPSNCGLSPAEITARASEIHRPFHNAVVQGLDARRAAGPPNILIAVHSFTPVFEGVRRPWHIGLLFNCAPRLAGVLASLIGEDQSVSVGINEPYAISDSTDFTIPEHGEKRGIPHVEIEIRQNLIESADGQNAWANRLADWFLRGQETPSVMGWMRGVSAHSRANGPLKGPLGSTVWAMVILFGASA